MSASLIEQLADHLNLERAEAKDALAALTARLNEEIEDTGEAVWPGLGRFHNDEAGLRFEPDEALALAVNQRYAGLKPVAVGGAGSSFRKQEVVSPEPEPDEPTAEADIPPAETDELDEDELVGEGWQPPEDSDEDHPLGPLPRQPFEEADFSVLAGFEETRERTDPSVPAAEAEPDDEDIPFEQAEADRTDAPASVDEYDLADEDDVDHPETAFADHDTDVDNTAADVPEDDVPAGEPVGKDSPFFEEWSESDFEIEDEEEDEFIADTEPLEPATELHQPDEPEPESIQDEDIGLEPAAAQADAEDVEPTAAPGADDEDHEQAAFVPPVVTPKAEPDAATAAPVAAAATADTATREPARPSRSATSRTAREEDERSRTPMILGGVIAVVVVLLLGLWLFSGDDAELDDGAGPLTQQTTPPPAQAPSADESPAAGDAADAGGQTDEAAPEGAASPDDAGAQDAPATQDATPGGSASSEGSLTTIDRDAGAWTLVVASWTIESRAEEEAAQYADRFRAQGYPVDILHHTENGVTRHRVAVGQFSDQAAAEAARESLTGLPEGTWLLRVRPGM